MKASDGVVAATALLLVEGARTFREWTPNLSEIRRAHPSEDVTTIADTRAGELASGIVILGIGGALSYMTSDPMPLVAGILVVMALSIITEKHLRSMPVEASTDHSDVGIDQVAELPGQFNPPYVSE